MKDFEIKKIVNLRNANLRNADLMNANLGGANLMGSNLKDANLRNADLRDANLMGSNLRESKNFVKIMGVEIGNYYWKAIDYNLKNKGYQYKVGLNTLEEGEIFCSDERILCCYPGLHFASKSWCKTNYPKREYLCKIRIPEGAQINEPWATDGKASADMIEIVQILLMETEEDITIKFKEDSK